ncbi:patatin-like phospholipase family protein [Algoriphagus sp. Y33]|uniref:patatin-like phospholipase family protein n=1 Tax=Algoriphagus sp. Y33 TaxID=2772483 RepID=UPI001780BC60|nr:patatin-like phospholipase family protein [Algoriphagus sp. Y33]
MLRNLTFLCFVFWVCQHAFSQTGYTSKPQAEQAKIGLVLSGGGAKGIAHVGILKAMEKAGLKPDYIVGTSMGAVVGGLYSLGYSAAELEEIIGRIDWGLLISNRVNFKEIAFEEKEYYNRYLLEFPIVEGKIAFPSGLIQGQVLSDVLHYFTWPANSYKTFDDFPIPFRCVATDIRTGQPVIFDRGYLQDALRSSIAIPTVFSAFDLDSTSVVDGGVVNNFPVDIVRQMGADVVIGVNVSREDFKDIDELGGFGGILMQLAMAPSLSITKENIEATDIYIKPDLGGYSTGSFSSFNDILELGTKAGEKYLDQFKHLADSLGRNDVVSGITFHTDSIQIDKIEILGNRLFSTDLVRSKLNIDEGDYVNRDELETAVHSIYGMNGFYKVDYRLTDIATNRYALLIRIKEKPSTLLSTSIHYDDQFSAGILLNLTAREVIGRNSRTILIADISDNPKFRVDYYKYTGTKKKFAFNFRMNFLKQELPNYIEGKEVDVQIGRNSRIEAQMISTNSLKQSFSIGGIFDASTSKFKSFSSSFEDIKNGRQAYFGGRFKYYRNSQNDRNYPTAGAEALLEGTLHVKNWLSINLQSGVDTVSFNVGEESMALPVNLFNSYVKDLVPNSYFSVYAKYSKFLRFNSKLQFHPDMAAGLTLSSEDNSKVFNEFFVGGYQNVRFNDTRFWGLNYAEIQTPNFIKFGAEFQYLPFKKINLRAGANFLGYSEQIPFTDPDFFTEINQQESYLGYGMDISYQSIVGPITAGFGGNDRDGELRGYISIGFSFNYSDR